MPDATDPGTEVAAWAASGVMALTGRPAAPPLGPPAGLGPALTVVGDRIRARTRELGVAVDLDPLAVLGERAAIAGLGRRGPTSCGGATRLLPCQDGWCAVTLARPDDVALVPAWLQLPGPPPDPWGAVADALATSTVTSAVGRGRWLGLPVAALGEVVASSRGPVVATDVGGAAPVTELGRVRVVELGSLWAGPLCGSLLAAAGADVVKVESVARPDGARQGPPALFDLLNAAKRSVAVDLTTSDGVDALGALLADADVVIESSRPRALEQLGLDAGAVMAAGSVRAWVSITGYGRAPDARGWVAFGDDAAAAGGLVATDAEGPVFCGDAVADPASGLTATAAVLDALAGGGRWVLDVSLAAVAAGLAGPTLPVGPGLEVAPARARPAPSPAPPLGADTDVVLAELGSRRSVGS